MVESVTSRKENVVLKRRALAEAMPLPILSLMLCALGFTTAEFVIAGILPVVAADLSISIPSAGFLVTAYALGMIVGGPLLTVMTARIPRKPLMVGLLIVFIVGNVVSAASPNYTVLLASRVFSALVVGTFFALAIVTASSMAPPEKRASTVAKVVLGINLGIVLGAPVGTLIGQNFGWEATFLALAAFQTVALLLVVGLVPAQPAVAKEGGSVVGELRVFGDRDVQLAIALTATGNVGIVAVFTYIAPLFTEVGGFDANFVIVLLVVYGVGALVGTLIGGRLSDRALMPSLICMLSALACGLALFWLVVGVNQTLTAVMTFVIGALAFSIIPGMQTRVLATATAAPTLAIAVNASSFQVAAFFAAFLGGRVIESSLGLTSLPIVGALVTVAGILVALYIWLRDRKPTSNRK